MTLHKAALFLSMLSFGAETVAFSPSSYAPYAVAAVAGSSCTYTGYKLYKHSGGNLTALAWDEGLSYAVTTLAVLYGYHFLSSQNALLKKLERERNNVCQGISVKFINDSLKEIATNYGLSFKNGQETDPLTDPCDEPLVLYRVVRNLVTTTGSVDHLQSFLTEQRKALHLNKAILEVKPSEDDVLMKYPNFRRHFKQLDKHRLYNAEVLITYNEKLLAVLKEHRYFFILENAVTGPRRFDYREEKRIRDKQLDASAFAQEMERHIYSQYNGVAFPFPFVSYIEKRDKEKQLLETALKKLDHYAVLPFQEAALIEQAQELLTLVNFLIQYGVTTEAYHYQKVQKVLFERNKEIRDQKLHGTQILLDQALCELRASLKRKEALKAFKKAASRTYKPYYPVGGRALPLGGAVAAVPVVAGGAPAAP
ncbi:hypothetical protein H0W26_05015 [Candidatus Dependentiae bacterium]|nr:hypothetical protein [Candidatus Dependentiae bacterium]